MPACIRAFQRRRRGLLVERSISEELAWRPQAEGSLEPQPWVRFPWVPAFLRASVLSLPGGQMMRSGPSNKSPLLLLNQWLLG